MANQTKALRDDLAPRSIGRWRRTSRAKRRPSVCRQSPARHARSPERNHRKPPALSRPTTMSRAARPAPRANQWWLGIGQNGTTRAGNRNDVAPAHADGTFILRSAA